MNIMEFLEQGARLEDTVSSCYRALAEKCPTPKAGDLFRKIAGQEINHANTLRAGKSYVMRFPGTFGDPTLAPADLQKGIRSAESLLNDAEAGADFKSCIERLHILETAFEQVHFDSVIEIKDASLKALFRQIDRDDRLHVEALAEILAGL